MKAQPDNQLIMKFPPPGRKFYPVVNELPRDSEGRVVPTKEDPDVINRLKNENLITRTNYQLWLDKKDKRIKELEKKLKEYESSGIQPTH
jgi:hypothetical protein